MDRILVDPKICSGKPVIAGTRIMVRNILSMLSAGYSQERILESYPTLKAEDVTAAINYAIECVDEHSLSKAS